jgi:hypothetical protein
MGIARPQTLALALSLGRLSASSNLCPRLETFDYRNLFLPHPALQHHADPQGSTTAYAMALKQTPSSFWAKSQHHLRQLYIIHAGRSSKHPSATGRMPQRLAGGSWPCESPAWVDVSPARFNLTLTVVCPLSSHRSSAVRADFSRSILDF